MSRILYWGAHSVLEHDELSLFHSLGHEVFSPGSYIHPSRPLDPIRPPLDMPEVPDLIAAVDALGQPGHEPHGLCNGIAAHEDTLLASKADTPQALLDWCDTIVVSAWEHTWLVPQWQRIRDKRVIWRTIGQSGDQNEYQMTPIVQQGCEVVRYSPKEANIPNFAGETALIRFGKDPDEWTGWTGEDAIVTNCTQGLKRRGDWTGYPFWERVTQGLPRIAMGGESENLGGTGSLTTSELQAGLRRARCYVATGTQPASYTLGFIEAGMTGIPMVSIGPAWMTILPYGHLMFEQHELCKPLGGHNDPDLTRKIVEKLLAEPEFAQEVSAIQRQSFVDTFGIAGIREQWGQFLGAPVRELVAA